MALVAVAFAFALSATAIALQILDERGAMGSAYGQKSFAVLLFQDIATVPFVAILPLFAVSRSGAAGGSLWNHMEEIGLAVGAVLAVVLGGVSC